MNHTLFVLLLLLATTTTSLHRVHAAELGVPDIDDIEYPEDEAPGQLEVILGKTLFFDTRLSVNKKQSCASCHNPDLGFGDGVAKGVGTMGGTLGRNTPHIYNLAWSSAMFWDGRMSTLEQQALGPIEAPGEMNMPLDQLIPRLRKVPYYRKTFDQVYPDEGLTTATLARAIAAFERTIISNNSPFDRYTSGDNTAMSPQQIRGLVLFRGKAKCTLCHDGVNFTDDSFHNIGLGDNDPGRSGINGEKSMVGAFKTPGLRNTLLTAPYMHDGSLGSLEAVIEHYNKGGNSKRDLDRLIKPLNLSKQEQLDLVSFMGALSDPVIIERPIIP